MSIEEDVKKIIETFMDALEKIDIKELEEVEYEEVLTEDESKVYEKDFREIFLKNGKSEKGYIVAEKAHWWKQ